MMIKLSIKRNELEINLETDELNAQEMRSVMGGVLEVLKISDLNESKKKCDVRDEDDPPAEVAAALIAKVISSQIKSDTHE